jgi:DNA-binding XRE family transcriptional regulator
MSQETLADLAGVHSTFLARVERGERDPKLFAALAIACALDVPIDELCAEMRAHIDRQLRDSRRGSRPT